MSDERRQRIERLKNRLYSRDYKDSRTGGRSSFEESEHQGATDWSSGDKIPDLLSETQDLEKKSIWAKRIFAGSIVFFIVAAAITLYMFFGGLNTVSSKNVDVEVGGPIGVAAGEPNEFEVTIKNGNNVPLERVMLVVTYPEGARDEGGELLTGENRIPLDDIGSGSLLRHVLTFASYGEKESVQKLFLALEYTVPGSNATFVKDKEHEITISSAPLIIDIDYPEEVTSGQIFSFDVQVSSNSTVDLENVVVRVERPFGFSLENSNPESVAQDVWNLGDMKPAEKKTITLTGRLQGQDEDERTFRFYTGTGTGDGKDIDTELVLSLETITIKRPFIALKNTINGQTGDQVVIRGADSNSGTIRWENTTPDLLTDLVVEAELIGLPLERESVVVPAGFYQSIRNSMIWDKSTNPDLASIDVGDEGNLSYSFNTKDSNFNETEGIIEILLKARAVRVTGSTREVITSETTQKVRLAAGLALSGRAVYSSGPFTNTGPIPPKAETGTTYTVILSVGGSYGDITDTQLTAVLPVAVEWLGVSSPSSESVTFNNSGRRLTWNLGTVREGSGITRPVRELAFQVRLTPSVNQVGSLVNLVDQIEIIGQDSRAGTAVTDRIQAITTSISTDPQYKQLDGFVVN